MLSANLANKGTFSGRLIDSAPLRKGSPHLIVYRQVHYDDWTWVLFAAGTSSTSRFSNFFPNFFTVWSESSIWNDSQSTSQRKSVVVHIKYLKRRRTEIPLVSLSNFSHCHTKYFFLFANPKLMYETSPSRASGNFSKFFCAKLFLSFSSMINHLNSDDKSRVSRHCCPSNFS